MVAVDEKLSVGIVMAFTSILSVNLVLHGDHFISAIAVFFGGILVSLSILGGPSTK